MCICSFSKKGRQRRARWKAPALKKVHIVEKKKKSENETSETFVVSASEILCLKYTGPGYFVLFSVDFKNSSTLYGGQS